MDVEISLPKEIMKQMSNLMVKVNMLAGNVSKDNQHDERMRQ